MNIHEQIKAYIDSQSETKGSDLQVLHNLMLQIIPEGRIWFLNGKNSENKVVSNPNIGYGLLAIKDIKASRGETVKTKDFYQIGLSANTTGISVYIFGIEDKTFLAKTFGQSIGKAKVSGYCIKFKSFKELNLVVLEAAIRHGIEAKKLGSA